MQRYWCKACERKFKADDRAFNAKAPTSNMSSALNLYYDGTSIRAIGRHLKQETGAAPSTRSIFDWVEKYTKYLTESTKDYHPNVGDTWIADETVLKIEGSKVWLWDIIDERTRVLLASRLSVSRTTGDAQSLMNMAVKRAGKTPKVVLTDSLAAYNDVWYGKGAEHRHGTPFNTDEDSTSKIERWHGTIKQRTKVMRGLKNLESAHEFTDGYLAYYNYLRPHEALENKTPAQEAGIVYPYKNWDELIRNYKPAHKVLITRTERGSVSLIASHFTGKGRHARITPMRPRISAHPRVIPQGAVYSDKSGTLSRRRFRGSRVTDLGGGVVYSRGRRHIRLD